jgi:hypothetical protein
MPPRQDEFGAANRHSDSAGFKETLGHVFVFGGMVEWLSDRSAVLRPRIRLKLH